MLKKDSNVPQAMLATGLSEDQIKPYLDLTAHLPGRLSIACFNSNTSTTVSESAYSIDALCSQLQGEGIFARRLNVDMAYHTPYMEPGASWYLDHLQNIQKGDAPPHSITMFSSVSGSAIHPDELCRPQYWVDNMVSPVKFFQAMQSLTSDTQAERNELIIEIGPHKALLGPSVDTAQSNPATKTFDYRSILERNKSSLRTALELVGYLFSRGYAISLMR